MNIRYANNKDANKIRSVVFSVLEEYGLQPDPFKTDTDLDDIEKYYFGNGGFFAVVEDRGEIVATVGLKKIDMDTCELRKMYCIAQARGVGLGNRLLIYSLNIAREMGYSKVELQTASVLKEAIGLYKKYGFVEYKLSNYSFRCDKAFYLNLAQA